MRVRYRTLTHTNPGWCEVTVVRRAGELPVAVVRDGVGHDGPLVVPAARMVAAAVHRELFADGGAWRLVLVRPHGSAVEVTFEQAFDGWYGRPTYTPLADADRLAAYVLPVVRVAGRSTGQQASTPGSGAGSGS